MRRNFAQILKEAKIDIKSEYQKVIWYCQSINGKSLLKKISPNKAISDHLPLVAKFERSVNDE